MRGEQRLLLEQALEQLPEEQREAVRLKYLEQATLSETAARLGKTEDAVSGLLQRGMAKLNRILRNLESDDS
jgi:RNA polymerase sigma-70 factor (ECF subfamily)